MTQIFTFPAGRYWIGDPCYVLDSQWQDLGEQTGWFGSDDDNPNATNYKGIFTTKNGARCFANGTKYGDGTYYDNFGHEYGVDAGLLSIVPESEVEDVAFAETSGHFMNFENDFDVCEEDGTFYFGTVEIATDDISDSDFEDFWGDDEWDQAEEDEDEDSDDEEDW